MGHEIGAMLYSCHAQGSQSEALGCFFDSSGHILPGDRDAESHFLVGVPNRVFFGVILWIEIARETFVPSFTSFLPFSNRRLCCVYYS